MTTSALYTTLNANSKRTTKTVTSLNPQATNQQIKSAMMALVGLTDNVYVGGTRVIKIDLDDEYTPEAVNNNG